MSEKKKLNYEELEKVTGGWSGENEVRHCPNCQKDIRLGDAGIGDNCHFYCNICGADLGPFNLNTK